jgi:hypothetical protein
LIAAATPARPRDRTINLCGAPLFKIIAHNGGSTRVSQEQD